MRLYFHRKKVCKCKGVNSVYVTTKADIEKREAETSFLGLVEVREDGWVSTMLNFETGVLIQFSVSHTFYYSNV